MPCHPPLHAGFPEASVNGALGVRAVGGSVRSASFYSRILCKRLHANNILLLNTVGEGSPLPFRNECYFNFKRNSLRHFLAKMPPPSAEGGLVRFVTKWLPTHDITPPYSVGEGSPLPFRNKSYFSPKRTANGRPYIKKFMQTP